MDIGLVRLKKDLSSRIKFWLFKHGLSPQTLYNFVTMFGLQNIISRRGTGKREQARNLLKKLFLSFSNVDWSRTKAYSFGMSGAIFVNLKGREPKGAVEKEQYEGLRNFIVRESKKLKNPKTDHELIRHIIKREEIYSGPCIDMAPDLLVVPMEIYSAFGDFEFFSHSLISPATQTGFHRMKGVFIIKGGPVRQRRILDSTNIVDVTPTILQVMAIPIPHNIDGKIPIEAFKPSYLKLHPVQYEKVEPPQKPSPKFEWTKEDENLVKERLKALGYLG
jgi:predicted AlkP superfamily phosphohydrolase/phosphomutase